MNYELGPELFELLNAKQHVGNQIPVIYGQGGLSEKEITHIETELGFKLPEDFVYLLQNIQDPDRVFFPWKNFEKKEYDESIAWVLHGIEFNVSNAQLWLPWWEEQPDNLEDALEIVRKDFPTWPKLLPIHSHRFLAAEPCQKGNPVFSIMQTDIIYYGANLGHYLAQEFVESNHTFHTYDQLIKPIEIWGEFAEATFWYDRAGKFKSP